MEVETAGVRTPCGGPSSYDGAMATSPEARHGFLLSCGLGRNVADGGNV
jgi:hypothetical protein